MFSGKNRRLLVVSSLFLFGVATVQAESSSRAVSDDIRGQEQQLDMLRSRVVKRPDILSVTREQEADKPRFPNESPCFFIRSVEWRGADRFAWLASTSHVVGACVGAQGLKLYQRWLAAQLLGRGYVTSQIVIPAQNLSQGHLIVEVIPGRVGVIREEGPPIGLYRSLFPANQRDLLNIRSLDQALESIRRLPGQSLTTLELVPGNTLGESDIVIQHPESSRRVVGLLSLDNAGVTDTGRHQMGAVVAVDSPLGLYDQLLLSYSTDVEPKDDIKGGNGKGLAWNVPVGYATVSLGASEWVNKRELLKDSDGQSVPVIGKTRRFDAGLNYVAYRSSHSKGSVQARIVRREDRSWVSSIELKQLYRDITSYELGFAHHEKLANGTLELALGLRGGIPGLSRTPGAVYEQQDWKGRYQVLTTRARIETAFLASGRAWRYQSSLLLQHALDPVPSTEYLQIGGRYTVRGFDGDDTLNGPDGWLWRNEIATTVFSGSESYAALDAGSVSTVGQNLSGRDPLIGVSMGVRGQRFGLGYDIAVGVPLNKPESLQSRIPTFDFSLSRRF